MKSLKNLLHMKFMQRALDSETKKQLEEEEKKIISEEHLYLDLPELKEKECFIKEKQIFLLREDLLLINTVMFICKEMDTFGNMPFLKQMCGGYYTSFA
uniref:Uncharacterized protein n=1 Tax=Canis lupus familiaris TaxID=9615 RepID=A0A8P0P6B0_CANLF